MAKKEHTPDKDRRGIKPTLERCQYVQDSGYFSCLTPDDKQCCIGTEIWARTHGYVSVKQEAAVLRMFQLTGAMQEHGANLP